MRQLERRTELADVALRARPVSDRRDQVLPVGDALRSVVPGGVLARGSVVAVGPSAAGGGGSVAFSLLAAPTSAGLWCAAVGTGDVGVVALAELGVDLEHLALVPDPGRRWAEAVAALVHGMDLVLVAPPAPVPVAVARRLMARVRERRAVLVVSCGRAPWPIGPDLQLAVVAEEWQGLGTGYGHLRQRRLRLRVTGRRAAARERTSEIWLPRP